MLVSIRTLAFLGAICGAVLGPAIPASAQMPVPQPAPAPNDQPTVAPAASPAGPATAKTAAPVTVSLTTTPPVAEPSQPIPPPPPLPAAGSSAPVPLIAAQPAAEDKALPTVTNLPPPNETASAPQTPAPKTLHKKATVKRAPKSKATRAKHKAVTAKKTAAGKGDSRLRDAQTHLASLGYYKSTVDGLNGSKTRAAIKTFQHDHKLKPDGKLTQKTYAAIVDADKHNAMMSPPPEMPKEAPPKTVAAEPTPAEVPPPPPPDFYATHPDFYGHYNQSYENPLLLGPTQVLYSRYAKVELTEDSKGASSSAKQYKITINGAPLILMNSQPTVIGVSRTYHVGDEDVMIFTSYRDKDPVCAYAYYLLVLGADGTKTREINECSRGYQAKAAEGSLFITFPESSDARAVESVWRYEHGGLLQKL